MRMRFYPGLLPLFSLTVLLAGCGLFERTEQLALPETVEEPEPAVVEQVPVEYRVLHKADYNLDDRETFKNFAILDNYASYQSELSKFSVEVPRTIDFANQRVVLLTMGTQPSGGYAVGVKSVVKEPERLLLTVELLGPGAGCQYTQAISNPYEFAAIDTFLPGELPVEFIEQVKTKTCE